jgi:hypothetical protein
MGIGYRCDASGCTFIVWDGDVSPEQWAAHVARLAADPEFPPGPLMLADISTSGGAPSIEPEDIEAMAARWISAATELGKMQWAIVPNEAWEKARHFEKALAAAGFRTMVFNEPWSACSWLGVDPDHGRAIISEIRAGLRT